MSNTSIQLKKSGISGNTPVDLIYGEVAINYADGKLFYKSDTGVTRYITNQQSFSTINSNNSLILATSGTDILNLVAGNNITISTNTTSKSITFGLPKDITNLNSISANTVSTKDILITGTIQTSTHSNLEGFIQAAFDTANTALLGYDLANTLYDFSALAYNAAKGVYLAEKYDKAIVPLQKFIEKFPKNEQVIEANYLIADAAYRTGDKATALTYYQKTYLNI